MKKSWMIRGLALTPFLFACLAPSVMAQVVTGSGSNTNAFAMAANAANGMQSFYTLLVNGGIVAGLGLALFGVFKMVFAHKRQESMMPGVLMLLGGGAAASLVALIGAMSGTLFGTSAVSQMSSTTGLTSQ